MNIQLIGLCLLTAAGLRATNAISLLFKVFSPSISLEFPTNCDFVTIHFRAFQGGSFLTKTQNIKSIYEHQIRVQVELTCACVLCQRRQSQKMLIWGMQKALSFAKKEMTRKETTVERVFVHGHFQIRHASLSLCCKYSYFKNQLYELHLKRLQSVLSSKSCGVLYKTFFVRFFVTSDRCTRYTYTVHRP